MHEILKMIAEDKSGSIFFFILFGAAAVIIFTYWFFEGVAKIVRAFREE